MDHDDIREFEMVSEQLEALYDEVSGVAGSVPDKQINEVMAPLIRSVLERAAALLKPEDLPEEYRVVLPDDATYGDASMILAIYRSTLRTVRARHTVKRHGKLHWVVEVDDPDPASKEKKRQYVPVKVPAQNP